jgi:hypothetical protein
VALNFWFEHVIEAYLQACASGHDWREAVAEAEQATSPRRVLTRKALQAKGIAYSRQHLTRKVANGTFPPPFQLPDV